MPQKNLTAAFVDSVRVDKRTQFQDLKVRGLVLRVFPSGAKSWNLVYVINGKQKRYTIGSADTSSGGLSLVKARETATRLLADVHAGVDPAADKVAVKAEKTFRGLGNDFLKNHALLEKRTWRQDETMLENIIYPVMGDVKLSQVKKSHVNQLLDEKRHQGKRAQARNIFILLRKIFNWAVERGEIDVSPIIGMRSPKAVQPRDRVLSDGEVREVWNALPGAPMTDQMRDVIRLLFLTGQRSGEVCGITQGEIDLEAATWIMEGERTKNGAPHVVPLSEAALAIVEPAMADRTEHHEPLFARVSTPMESNAVAKASRKHLQLFDERWTPHDIRRTVATGMADAGVLPHIIEMVLNHLSGFRAGVAGTYNRSQYQPEMRRALDIWSERLEAIVNDGESKVIPLKARA